MCVAIFSSFYFKFPRCCSFARFGCLNCRGRCSVKNWERRFHILKRIVILTGGS
jgi:hypothetical protein